MNLKNVQTPSILNDEIKQEKNPQQKLVKKYLIGFFILNFLLLAFIFFNYKGKGIYSDRLNLLLFLLLIFFNVFTVLVIVYLFMKNNIKISKMIFEILDLTHFLILVLTIIFFVQIYILTFTEVEGKSMEPTLHQADRVIVTQIFSSFKDDTIVVFRAKNYTKSDHQEYFVKRIKALPGDQIKYIEQTDYSTTNLEIYVNEVKVFSVTNLSVDKWKDWIDEINGVIPKGKYLLIGDNINESYDSKVFGLIDERDILGIVRFRIFKKFGAIK